MTMRRRTTLILGSFLLATTLLAQKSPAPTNETFTDFGAIGLAPGQSLRMTTGLVSPRDAAVPVTIVIAFDIYTPTADRSRWQVIDRRETRVTLQVGEIATADYTNVRFEEVIVRPSLIEIKYPLALMAVIELREGGRTFAVVTHSLIEARKGSAH